jgi:hypothetical protein
VSNFDATVNFWRVAIKILTANVPKAKARNFAGEDGCLLRSNGVLVVFLPVARVRPTP